MSCQKCRNAQKCSKFTLSAVSQESIAPQWLALFMPTKIYSYLGKLRLLFYLRDQKLENFIGRVDFSRKSIFNLQEVVIFPKAYISSISQQIAIF